MNRPSNPAAPPLFYGNDQEAGEAFKPVGLADQIARHLRAQILTGTLKGGEQLLEEGLRSEFGVSRTPLREAFRMLEKEGLVEILPRRGTFVRKITRKDIEENFPVRAVLEGLAARFAHARLSASDIDELPEAYSLMERAARKGDFIEYAKHHNYFHEIFITASENEILISLLRTLRMHTLWHRYTCQYYKEDFEYSLSIHRRIVTLFKDRSTNPEEIERVVREHIERALKPFLSAMEKLEGGNHP